MKFRAWSLREQCWEGAFSIHKDGYFRNGDTEPIWQTPEEAGVIVTQYTEMLDRNGKEIYVGDLVQWCGGPGEGGAVFEVEWPNHVSGEEIYRSENWEVVGNIYEQVKEV